jgi:GNAT superfamily N-acetyltransferase
MLQDRQSFKELWQRFAEQQFEEGSLQLPNEHNLDLHVDMFDCYVKGTIPGLVLLVSDGNRDVGVHMEGELVGGFELSIGRYTMLWGDYLLPEYRGQGHSHKIHKAAMDWTYEQGYTGGMTGLLAGGETIPKILERTVDTGTHGATKTMPFSINVYWKFNKPDQA